jgi:hypothetical protein
LTDPGRQRGPPFGSGCLGTRKPRKLSPANPGTKMPIIIRGSEPKAPKIPSPQHQLRHDRRLRPNARPGRNPFSPGPPPYHRPGKPLKREGCPRSSVLVGAFYGDHPWHLACLGRLEEAFKKTHFRPGRFQTPDQQSGFCSVDPCQRPVLLILLASEYLRRPKPGKRTGQNAAAMRSASAWIGRTLRAASPLNPLTGSARKRSITTPLGSSRQLESCFQNA